MTVKTCVNSGATLVLGGAQIGLDYGVANTSGRVSGSEVLGILKLASSRGMRMVDTAVAYGESESALGEAGVEGWSVITKLPAIPDGCGDILGWVRRTLEGSLGRLGISKLYGCLLHESGQLSGELCKELAQAMMRIRDEGLAKFVGVSVYSPSDLEDLPEMFPLDLVQAPLNVFDRRLIESGWLSRLVDMGAEVHVRSVFLQGLLLMSAQARPNYFKRWGYFWARWEAWLQEHNESALAACLGFVLAQSGVNHVVVGVDSTVQLENILTGVGNPSQKWPDWSCGDLDLIDPNRWGSL